MPKEKFSEAWDGYVERALVKGQEWPGDEWGNEELWDKWFKNLFGPCGADSWQRAIEIGQGTGKYTRRVLEAGCGEVLACDVSQKFLELCSLRLESYHGSGRLHLHQIDECDPYSLQHAAEQHGWKEQVDAIFAIDAMVHLNFTNVACYLLAGTEILRRGGYFILTFADGTSAGGLQKMVKDMDRTVRERADPRIACFHWVSPELVKSVATFMGYSVMICGSDEMNRRDGHLVMQFTDPEQAQKVQELRT